MILLLCFYGTGVLMTLFMLLREPSKPFIGTIALLSLAWPAIVASAMLAAAEGDDTW